MKAKPTKEELAYLVGDCDMSLDDCNAALIECIQNGDMEYTGKMKDGEPTFRLTKQGQAKAEALFANARNEMAMIKGLQ
jgi:hypothetical protein